MRYLWEGKATDAVLEFLRTTRVGCVGLGRVPPKDRGESESGEEGGLGPPWNVPFVCLSFLAVGETGSVFFSFLCFFLYLYSFRYERTTMTG